MNLQMNVQLNKTHLFEKIHKNDDKNRNKSCSDTCGSINDDNNNNAVFSQDRIAIV